MQRISLLVFGTLAIAGLALVNAQETTDKLPSYSVKFVLIGADGECISDEPQLIKDGVSTDISTETHIKAADGSTQRYTLSYLGRNLAVPSPARMANPQSKDVAEFVWVGPKITCRIQRIDEASVLLDATLTNTVPGKSKMSSGILNVTTHQLRSVQPVRLGDTVTLSWPEVNGVEKPRQVTITVLEPK